MSNDIKIDEGSLLPAPSSEKVYQGIARTLDALDKVCIDGHSPAPLHVDLLGQSFKRYIPDTEVCMKLSEALPMSDADIAAVKAKKDLEQTLGYIKANVSATAKTLNEITGARIRVAYRLCRFMSHLTGQGKLGEPSIFTMTGNIPDANLYEIPMPYDPIKGLSTGMATPRVLLEEISNSQYEYTILLGNQAFKTAGMSILPPPMHDGYYPQNPAFLRKNNYTPADYDPKSDTPLAFYLNIMEFLVRHLGIGGGNLSGAGAYTGTDTQSPDKSVRTQNLDDRSAVLALLNPDIARLAWPARDDLETFEEHVLIPYVERLIVDNSPLDAGRLLEEEMGLTHFETEDYMEVAKTYAMDAHNFDTERERSIMINKIHGLAGRCGDAGMVSTELKSLMSVSQILGLTKHAEDTNIDKRDGLKSALEEKLNAGKLLKAGEDDKDENI